MSNYHEPPDTLGQKTRDFTRVLNSLKEEIEAVDWYNQRLEASDDPTVRSLLAHNRDEEIEHACMALEWLRRNMDGWDETMRTYFFTTAEITEIEEMAEEGQPGGSGATDLGIRGLREGQ